MKRHGRWVVSAALFAVTAVVAGAEGLDVSSHPMIGEAAPACDLEEVAGGKVSPESLRGRYVVRHFGTSW